MKKYVYFFLFLLFLVASGVVLVKGYSYIFAKDVKGVIDAIEKPINPTTVVDTGSGQASEKNKLFFSYAVAIRENGTNEIFTASTEDRQWAVAQVGKCVVAKFYPYPPWQLDKAGTYYGVRLMRLYDCNTEPPPPQTK